MVVEQGQVCSFEAKVESIHSFLVQTNHQELCWFLGMAGYFRGFCHNFYNMMQGKLEKGLETGRSLFLSFYI